METLKIAEQKDTVRAVDRMIDILQVFTFETQELSLTQICLQAGLPKTTTYRILCTLEQRNMVALDPQTGKYHLGYELVKMGNIAQSGNSLQRVAHSEMEVVTQETAQTCNLYIREGFERRCIAQVEGTQYIRRFSYLGAKYPLYCGAGKLLLAYSDASFQDQYFNSIQLKRYTDSTIVDEEKLKADLQQILKDGYLVTRGERDAMSATVCTPIYDYTEKVVATITISGPIYLFSDDNVLIYREKLFQASGRISRNLGYVGSAV